MVEPPVCVGVEQVMRVEGRDTVEDLADVAIERSSTAFFSSRSTRSGGDAALLEYEVESLV